MMNVGLPSANFVDCKSTYRPFVLFSKGVALQDEWKPFGLSSLSVTPVSSKSETPPIEVEDPLLTVTTEKKKKN